MKIQIYQVPYDSGHKNVRTGNGPLRFIEHGLEKILESQGNIVSEEKIESKEQLTTEIGTAMELNRILAGRVKRAAETGSFPLVISGNCNSCLGTLAGIGSDRLGVIWFDAHGDFNTPETTVSGFFDGMPLAMAAGRCWKKLLETVPGFKPIAEENIVHIGARDLDADEEQLMIQSEMTLIPPSDDILESINSSFLNLKQKVDRMYLHVDMDVLDAGEAKPNRLAVPGGLSLGQVLDIVNMAKERFEICAAAISSFDPDYDVDDIVLQAGISIIKAIVDKNFLEK